MESSNLLINKKCATGDSSKWINEHATLLFPPPTIIYRSKIIVGRAEAWVVALSPGVNTVYTRAATVMRSVEPKPRGTAFGKH